MSISVVICTRNRFRYLKVCLTSLLEQSYPPKEIIIIDDGSRKDFDTYKFFKKRKFNFKDKQTKSHNSIDLIIIKNKDNSGVVASRNTGIKAASGDIVAFLDDDGFAHKNWLKNLIKNYKNKKILGVGGPVIEIGRYIKTNKKPIKKLAYIQNGKIITNYRINKLKQINNLPKKFVPFLQGGNMSFRKKTLLKIRGGDINFTGNCYREETDISFRITKRGKLLFEPSAVTYHNTAKKGGFREVINFELDKFLYYMFRNTTYFFFKHFNFKKAYKFTKKSVKRQIKLIKNNKTGLTRDYLQIINKNSAIKSTLFGTINGFYNWFRLRKKKVKFTCSEPVSLIYFKLIIVGGSIKLIELENKTHIIKKLFCL